MRKNSKIKLLIVMLISFVLLTGCTKVLKVDKKPVINPQTGQSLTKNILCKPESKELTEIYEKHKDIVNIEKLDNCKDLNFKSNGYEGLWTSFFVKPLAIALIKIGLLVKNYGLAIIIATIIIKLILIPINSKQVKQSQIIQELKPELDKIEKKYQGKTEQADLMKKSQEMAMLYKKYKINPLATLGTAILQIIILIAFYEAIMRVPAIFEDTFLGFQLGTSPLHGLKKGNFIYLILIILNALGTIFINKINMPKNQGEKNPMSGMTLMMPIFIIFISFFLPSALNLYWIVQNIFGIIQGLIIKRKDDKNAKV